MMSPPSDDETVWVRWLSDNAAAANSAARLWAVRDEPDPAPAFWRGLSAVKRKGRA